jgi:hypothetical protein
MYIKIRGINRAGMILAEVIFIKAALSKWEEFQIQLGKVF